MLLKKSKNMKNLIFILCLVGLFSCRKDVDNNPLQGLWISEFKDTINVSEASLLIYMDYETVEKYLFDYKIKNDSLYLFPMQSSNINASKRYYYELNNGNLLIKNFFNHNEINFIKEWNE